MIIIIDDREKQPYSFSPGINTVIKRLGEGDYSLVGLENIVSIERKSLSDYIQSITEERDRFLAELDRFSTYKYACIVVEGQLPEILDKGIVSKYTSSSPANLFGSTVSICIDKKIPVFFCSDRQHAILFIEKMLKMFWDHYATLQNVVNEGKLIKKDKINGGESIIKEEVNSGRVTGIKRSSKSKRKPVCDTGTKRKDDKKYSTSNKRQDSKNLL